MNDPDLPEFLRSRPFTMRLPLSTERRLIAYIDRMNHEPFWADDQLDPFADGSFEVTILAILDGALSESERAAGLYAEYTTGKFESRESAEERWNRKKKEEGR